MNVLKNQNLMQKVINDVDTSRFILLCDHLESDSMTIIKALIDNRLKNLKVVLICLESDSTDQLKSDMKVIDLFSDYHSIDSNLSHHLSNALAEVSDESVIIIDSLTPLLAMDSMQYISRTLSQLCGRFRQLVCVLHVDCHSPLVCESIEQLSHFVIHLTKIEDNSHFKAIIRHRKPHRKTHFSVKESMEFFKIVDHSVSYVTKTGPNAAQTTADPTLVDLPFNLNLKDTELEAKNRLQMPFIKNKDNESKVFYEFDQNDDFDDDDPDEDLDL